MIKQIPTIKLHVTFKGQGIVNYDGKDQKQVILDTKAITLPRDNQGKVRDNLKIAKATYAIDGDGNVKRSVKVSSDCIRQAIFKLKHNPNIVFSPVLFNDWISSKTALVRGYFFPKDGGNAASRKSPLTVLDALEVSGQISTFNVHSNSGARSDNSLYYVEEMGETRFENDMYIDLSELKHIVLSDTYGRNSVFSDGEESLVAKLREKYGVVTTGFFRMDGETVEVPEYGVEISDEAVVSIVRDLIDHIKQLHIKRSNAYLECDTIEVFAFENGAWIPMDEKSNFTVKSSYVLIEDQDGAKTLHDDVCDKANQGQTARKEAKKEEAAKKASKKAAKDNT